MSVPWTINSIILCLMYFNNIPFSFCRKASLIKYVLLRLYQQRPLLPLSSISHLPTLLFLRYRHVRFLDVEFWTSFGMWQSWFLLSTIAILWEFPAGYYSRYCLHFISDYYYYLLLSYQLNENMKSITQLKIKAEVSLSFL